ncbi:Ig-like domain-containing protein [Mucilaginibacter ginkgonis]|nr:Ig-like domain-containing protein [Mucilaginibacter ginkgonis]
MTRHFNAKNITIEFDEYFKLSNQYSEIVMSPAMEKSPEYKISGKKLVINLRDTLQPNTTYTLNFGKAIADVNESNVLKNFTYVFSTGEHIDSLSVAGNVTNVETGEKEKEATVMLFPLNQDSVMFGKKKPSIFATTDSSGNFSINNLHDGYYRIYALKEASPNKIYDNDQELIGFLKNPIHLTKDTSGIVLKLFKQQPEKFRVVDRNFDGDGKLAFTFNKPLTNPSVKVVYPPGVDESKYVEFSKTKDSARVYLRNMDFDSLRVAFFDNGKALDTITKKKGRKETFTRIITFRYNLDNDGRLKPGSDLQINSILPLESFDQGQFSLTEDSVPVNFTLQKDANNLKLLNLKYRFREKSDYQLTINEDAVTDIYGDKNKKTFKRFTVNKTENYGTLTIKLNVPDTTRAYVAQVLNSQKQVLRTVSMTKNTAVVLKDFLTGKYRVRIIYDDNRNDIWDSGSVKGGRQPEKIWIYEKEINLRANWETEESIDVPRESNLP